MILKLQTVLCLCYKINYNVVRVNRSCLLALLFYVIRNSIVFDTRIQSDLNKGIVPGLFC